MTSTTMTTTEKPQPRRSPALALILALVPGLGQIYAGQRARGWAVLFFVPSLLGLTAWRLIAAGVNYTGPAINAPSDAQLRAAWGGGIFLFAIVGLIYLWSLWDAVRSAGRRPLSGRPVLLLATLACFVIGWNVVQIDLEKAIARLGEIGPRLTQLAWPWDEAFVRGVERTQASVWISVPCGAALETPEEVPGAPYIEVTPNCGEMAGPVRPDGTRNPPGTELEVRGRGFRPGKLVETYWEPPNTDEFRPRSAGRAVTVEADTNGAFVVRFNIPNFTIPGGDAPSMTAPTKSKLTLRQEQEEGPLRPSNNLLLALEKIIETVFLGLMATLFGVVLALPISFFAARNLMSTNAVTLAIYALVRLVLNIIRSIEPLIWAVIAIIWVGLGPFAGTLALTLHTIAALGKLYSEAIENIDSGPIEAIQATGANWLQVIVYAIIPQVIPPFVSFTIYRWDVNIRSSTIIGAVGGGGIGFLLIQWIRLSDYDSAGIAVWLIAIVVSVLDYVSAQIRKEFV